MKMDYEQEMNDNEGKGDRVIASLEEPTFDQVDKFHSNPNNFPVGDSQTAQRSTISMDEKDFLKAQDQIVRGLVYFENSPGSDSSTTDKNEDKPLKILDLIPAHEQQYPSFKWYKPGVQYGIIYVKGHSLDKKLFFEWSHEVVFFCPALSSDRRNLDLIKKEAEEARKPVNNRFIRDKEFHYLDRKRKLWISFPFGELDRINNRFKSLAEGSFNCTQEVVTAINRLR